MTAHLTSKNGLDETPHAHTYCPDPYCDWFGYVSVRDGTWRVAAAHLSSEHLILYDAWCGDRDDPNNLNLASTVLLPIFPDLGTRVTRITLLPNGCPPKLCRGGI